MRTIVAISLALGLAVPSQDDKKFAEKDGLIVIEAEHFHAKAKKDALTWELVKEPAGFSGTGAMEAKPNDDVNNNEDFVDLSPRMDYKVNFAKAGKFKIWVRGWGRGESDNSCHLGLNGKAVDTCDRLGEWPAEEWAWLNDTHDGESATLEVKEAGVHTLNVWMREDGFILDKILLARDDKYEPKEKGPAETKE